MTKKPKFKKGDIIVGTDRYDNPAVAEIDKVDDEHVGFYTNGFTGENQGWEY